MSNYILELFCEAIPARMQNIIIANLETIANEQLKKINFKFNSQDLKCFISYNRISLIIQNLELEQITNPQIKIGPKIDANKNAIDGFLKSNNISDINQLKIIDGYYQFSIDAKKIYTKEILEKNIPLILQKLQNQLPKLMRWNIENNSIQAKWIRPIRNILSILNDQIVNFDFLNIKTNDLLPINYDLSQAIKLNNSSEYLTILNNNYIIQDQYLRKQIILDQFNQIKQKHNLEIIDANDNSELLNEVIAIFENPLVLTGSIPKKYLELPDESLILTLESHQKYFCCRNLDGTLSNIFLFVTNQKKDPNYYQAITRGYENVAKARLNDTEFFIEEDLKIPLINRIEDLKKIIFHQKLGSVFDKVERIKSIAKYLSIFVSHADISLIEKTSELIKVDLTTKAVAELPELQGKIGSFYALKQNQDVKISVAIYEHYLPISTNSELPKTALGIVLSIADKIDSLVSFFLINEKPSSSRDPYALRRSAIGIIRIIIENNLTIPIRLLIEKSINNHSPKLQKKFLGEENFYQKKVDLINEILLFIIERLRIYLKDHYQIKTDIVNVIIDEYVDNIKLHKLVNIIYLTKKIIFFNKFIDDKKNLNLIELYKRSSNILTIEEKKDKLIIQGKPKKLKLKNKFERDLNSAIKSISKQYINHLKDAEFQQALSLLLNLEKPLNVFFDNVIVNDEDEDLKLNRLLILSQIRDLFKQFGDFSKLNL